MPLCSLLPRTTNAAVVSHANVFLLVLNRTGVCFDLLQGGGCSFKETFGSVLELSQLFKIFMHKQNALTNWVLN